MSKIANPVDPNAPAYLRNDPSYQYYHRATNDDVSGNSLTKNTWTGKHPLGTIAAFIAAAYAGSLLAGGGLGGAGGAGGAGGGGGVASTQGTGLMGFGGAGTGGTTGQLSLAGTQYGGAAGGLASSGGIEGGAGIGSATEAGAGTGLGWQDYAKAGMKLMGNNNQQEQQQNKQMRIWTDPAVQYTPKNELQQQELVRALQNYKNGYVA